MKRILSILLVCIFVFSSDVLVQANQEFQDSEYIVEEVTDDEIEPVDRENLPCPYTLYIMGVHTTIRDKEDGKIYMGVQVYCTETMQEIKTIFYLQQQTSSGWSNVATGTITSEDVNHHVKVMSVLYAPSGNYRVKTVNQVKSYNGYTESITGFSPEMYYYNPNL